MNENELLREHLKYGLKSRWPIGISKNMLERELVFIENRHLESYFNIAHELIDGLKRGDEILLSPGRGWMINSYVCWLLGITCMHPESLDANPLLTWCDENKKPIIDIEVDEDSFHKVYNKAIELFGYNNVARMPALLSDKNNLKEHEAIGITSNGNIVYLHSSALLICKDGCIGDYYPLQVITDENGNSILCTKDFIPECDNKTVFRFNILKSHELTRIKRIQELIRANGKRCPQFWEKDISDEKYVSFHSGTFKGIPYFESLQNYEKTIRMLLIDSHYIEFHVLLEIMVLFSWGVGQSLKCENDVEDFQNKYGINPRLGRNEIPWGFFFKEEVFFFMNRWIGFTCKQVSRILVLIEKPDQVEIEKLRKLYLQNGIENAFRLVDLEKIWDSLFNRDENRHLFSKSHLAGDLYLSVFLAKLKVEFEDEFMQQYEEEQE